MSNTKKLTFLKALISNFQQPVFDVPKDCGPKPSNPNKFNSPNYNKNSQEYKFYKKRLQEWNDCNQ